MTQQLTEEDRAELQDAFRNFDRNGDGHVSVDEIIEVMRAAKQNPTKAEVREMIAEVDVNKNGYVEYSEFEEMMMKRGLFSQTQEEDQLREAFQVFDRNGDGFITTDELRDSMTNLGEQLSPQEIEHMISVADVNNDGKVHYNEFVKMIVQ